MARRVTIAKEPDTSTLVDERTGQKVLTWTKRKGNPYTPEDYAAAMRRAFEGLPVRPRIPLVTPSDDQADRVLVSYVWGDPHVGMQAWPSETGAQPYDLKIAEKLHRGCMHDLIRRTPDAAHALFVDLGDALHTSNFDALSKSGHRFDVDGRLPKAIDTLVDLEVECIEALLWKHDEVTVCRVGGNHDYDVSPALTTAIRLAFRDNPRVKFPYAKKPKKHQFFRFGCNLIGASHGDTLKEKDAAAIMACDAEQWWHDTTYRHFYLGHVHSENSREYPGVQVESFQTVAPGDAWHRGAKWRSKQSMTAIVYDHEEGRQGTVRVCADAIRRRLGL